MVRLVLAIVLSVFALAGTGCASLYPSTVNQQEWFISDGCVVWVKGAGAQQYSTLQRIIEIADDCELKIEGEVESHTGDSGNPTP